MPFCTGRKFYPQRLIVVNGGSMLGLNPSMSPSGYLKPLMRSDRARSSVSAEETEADHLTYIVTRL